MNFFKKVKKVLKVSLLVAAIVVGGNIVDHYRTKPVIPMTAQRRAEHKIMFYQSGHRSGSCTGTAIGPHAILTATHCDEKQDSRDIELDYQTRTYHIEKFLSDGNDHDIYLVDGPAFTNTVPYKVRPAKLGEHVYLYGSGGGEYPPRRLDGQRIELDDPSDVDADAGVVAFSMPVIPGDSGSAVFADDGSIVAVTTYRIRDPWMYGFLEDDSTVDFIPNFTPDQIKESLSFEPTPYAAPLEPKEDNKSLFELFGLR